MQDETSPQTSERDDLAYYHQRAEVLLRDCVRYFRLSVISNSVVLIFVLAHIVAEHL